MTRVGYWRAKAGEAAALPVLWLGVLMLAACGSEKPAELPDHSPTTAGLANVPATKQPQSSGLSSGSTINVQLLEVLDSSDATYPQFVVARIPDDVMGVDGKLAFEAGSTALLQIRALGKQNNISRIDLALYSVTSGGRQVRFVAGAKDLATASYTENASLGPAHRTVHLAQDARIPFRLQAPVSLKESGS